MKAFDEFREESESKPGKKPKAADQRHKIKEQLGKFDSDNWENLDYDTDLERFEKFKSRK